MKALTLAILIGVLGTNAMADKVCDEAAMKNELTTGLDGFKVLDPKYSYTNLKYRMMGQTEDSYVVLFTYNATSSTQKDQPSVGRMTVNLEYCLGSLSAGPLKDF
ncbi:MAG: hypothetical protein AB7F59_12615 [Bdellovibrionales bacterium]